MIRKTERVIHRKYDIAGRLMPHDRPGSLAHRHVTVIRKTWWLLLIIPVYSSEQILRANH